MEEGAKDDLSSPMNVLLQEHQSDCSLKAQKGLGDGQLIMYTHFDVVNTQLKPFMKVVHTWDSILRLLNTHFPNDVCQLTDWSNKQALDHPRILKHDREDKHQN